jgi:hypothetical protein
MKNYNQKLKTILIFLTIFFGVLFFAKFSLAACSEPGSYIFCEDFDNNFNHSNWQDWQYVGTWCTPYTGTNPATDCEGLSSVDYRSTPYSIRYTVEAGKEGGWGAMGPKLSFPQQSASSWTYVRWYQKWCQGTNKFSFVDQLVPQEKGFYFSGGGSTYAWKFQVRGTWRIPGYDSDGHNHFGFHSYVGGEKFATWTNHDAPYPEDHADDCEWHYYEIGVQPSTKSLKLWIDGVLKVSWINSDFVEDSAIQPSGLWIPLQYGWPGAESPKTQSFFIDNIVVSNSYIGPLDLASDTTPPSPPSGVTVS